jgi:DNA-directed RNA polymerase specialized sigma24 family protein
MSDQLSAIGTAIIPSSPAIPSTDRKAIDLAIIKKGAKDYLDFLDATKEVFYGYLYHRTGSLALAQTLLSEIFLDLLSRAMSLWWFGTLSLKTLLDATEHVLAKHKAEQADLDDVYIPTLSWLTPQERESVSTLHDALWSLPRTAAQMLVLSMLLGIPDERIAAVLRQSEATVGEHLKTARGLLMERWQPLPSLIEKLPSLVFLPSLDLQSETKLRFGVVEKYNALRFRRYQWVIIAGLFAVMSNVIVAGVIAFAVIMVPPTSLRGVRTQVASLDALVLERQMKLSVVNGAVMNTIRETQGVAAYDATRRLTSVGLGVALEALKDEQRQETQINRTIDLLKRAETAMEVFSSRIVAAMKTVMGWL